VEAKPPAADARTQGSSGARALSVDHLAKQLGDRIAFDDVSFEVGHGEVFGFLGPNGAGKTTTVRTLGTLIAPTSGSATVAGISVMPESPGLYLRLSVTENLECFADLYEVPDSNDRIDRALRAVNLADRAHDACGTLSKGLRQRVALARALLSDPEVLFLDEPTSGLDPVATRDVHELIAALGQRGVTIFLTTHRLEEAERLCDRVAILNTTLRAIGRPDELREQLFAKTLTVRTLVPLPEPDRVFAGIPAVDSWHQDGPATYVLAVSESAVSAPAVTRALVAASADVLSISESHHSLEDVYLELIDEDQEVGHARESPVGRGDIAHRVQRHPRDARPCPRPRGGAAARRRTRLADRVRDVRPRTARDGNKVMRSWLTGVGTVPGRLPSGRAAVCGYGLAGQAGVSNPPSPIVSGALPTSLGIRPEIGPPFAADAGVVSVWSAPSSTMPTQRSGVMPWTCAMAGLAGSRAIPLATASATITALHRLRAVLPPTIPIDLLCGSPTT
jgi:ABC-2 type transport system ATP-binding protein